MTKPAKEFTDALGRRKIKGNMDIELAVDAMEQSETVDHLVLFSGDGDFTTLVDALQRKGRKVSVVSTMATQPAMIADDLRRQADHFIDLMTLKAEVGRDPSERAVRPTEPTEPADISRTRPSQRLARFCLPPYRQGKIPPEINNRQIRPGKIISWLILDVSKSSNGTNDMIWVPKQDD